MASEQLLAQIDELVRRHLPMGRADVRLLPDQELRSMGLNSLRAVDLLLSLEDTFGIRIPDAALTAETFRSVRTLTRVVAPLIESDEPAPVPYDAEAPSNGSSSDLVERA